MLCTIQAFHVELHESSPSRFHADQSQHVGAVFPMFLSLGVLLFLRGHPSVKIPHPIVTGAQEEARPLVAGSSKFIADQMRRPNLGPQRHWMYCYLTGLTGRDRDSGTLVVFLNGLTVLLHVIHNATSRAGFSGGFSCIQPGYVSNSNSRSCVKDRHLLWKWS